MSLFIARYWPQVLIAVLSGAIVWLVTDAVWEARYQAQRVKAEQAIAESARAEAAAVQGARVAERRLVETIADISAQHEARIREIQSENDTRIGELVAGTKRLRREIAAYATERLSGDTAAAGEPSDAARRGAELVSAAVGVGAACDARQAALIEAYNALRRPAP